MSSFRRTVCVLAILLAGTALLVFLGCRPDFNPFYSFFDFKNLRTITTLKSFVRVLEDRHDDSTVYPSNRTVAIREVQSIKPKLAAAVEQIEFRYHVLPDGLLVVWASKNPHHPRSSALFFNRRVYTDVKDVAGLLVSSDDLGDRVIRTRQ